VAEIFKGYNQAIIHPKTNDHGINFKVVVLEI